MIPFGKLHPYLQGATGIYLVVLLLATAALITLELPHRKPKTIAALIFIHLMLYTIFQCICECLAQTAYTAWMQAVEDCFSRIPVAIVVCLLLLVTAFEGVLWGQNRKWERSHITVFSMKEAIDNLPVGLCCYESSGQIMLKNKVMEELCRACTGEALLNANLFLQSLRKRTVQAGNDSMLKLDDGRVFSLSDGGFSAEAPELRILTAADITEQYKNTQMLAAQQAEVAKLNEELMEYSKQIVSSITAREILNAKVKLHDELGSILLASKRYILSGGTIADKTAIESSLRRSLQYLRHGTEAVVRDEFSVIMETAEKLDMKIQVVGSLTQREPQRHVIVTGIHECLTNTIRHAQGNILTVRLEETGEMLSAEFTNNGKQPEGRIEERGGLALLRTLTQQIGGAMELQAVPQFKLTIQLPKEESHHALSCADCGRSDNAPPVF